MISSIMMIDDDDDDNDSITIILIASANTTTTPSSLTKKKVNVEKEHSKSMLQHVKNIRSEKQLHQMLGSVFAYTWMNRWID